MTSLPEVVVSPFRRLPRPQAALGIFSRTSTTFRKITDSALRIVEAYFFLDFKSGIVIIVIK
ncbi:MAG: hypothetical protein ACOCVM_06670 [Desulfovibrionaceae bacterium]